jgi:hypothetical protein
MQKQFNYLISCPGTPQEWVFLGRRLFIQICGANILCKLLFLPVDYLARYRSPKYVEHFTLYGTVVVYLIDKYAMIFSLHYYGALTVCVLEYSQ